MRLGIEGHSHMRTSARIASKWKRASTHFERTCLHRRAYGAVDPRRFTSIETPRQKPLRRYPSSPRGRWALALFRPSVHGQGRERARGYV